MYAIVDIETTGGHASANGITEIAVVLHDGMNVTERYQTLVNPGMDIPVYIRALTGISNEMASVAPSFNEVASRIHELIHDKIFIAHNVNFDYSFLRHHLAQAGHALNCKKLCTVRLGRKIFPGLPSYSLGKLSRQMGIEIESRHRAGGDAEATAILFSMMLQSDKDGHIKAALNQRSKEQSLPPHLPKEQIDALPFTPGVYYFKDAKGKVVYVGKAKNLKKRVCSHFQNNNPGRQKQDFLRSIHSVSYQECGTELMALILEAIEIKRLWPANNRALKRFEQGWGLYAFEDQKGYLRMAVDKRRKYSTPAYIVGSALEGHQLLRTLVNEFELCPKLCFIQTNNDPCTNPACKGACSGHEPAELYNQRINSAIEHLKLAMPTFALFDQGRSLAEKSCILVEGGEFYGMGYLAHDSVPEDLSSLKDVLTPYPGNEYIKNIVHQHASRFPERKLVFS